MTFFVLVVVIVSLVLTGIACTGVQYAFGRIGAREVKSADAKWTELRAKSTPVSHMHLQTPHFEALTHCGECGTLDYHLFRAPEPGAQLVKSKTTEDEHGNLQTEVYGTDFLTSDPGAVWVTPYGPKYWADAARRHEAHAKISATPDMKGLAKTLDRVVKTGQVLGVDPSKDVPDNYVALLTEQLRMENQRTRSAIDEVKRDLIRKPIQVAGVNYETVDTVRWGGDVVRRDSVYLGGHTFKKHIEPRLDETRWDVIRTCNNCSHEWGQK